ncbi:MAG: hypothetical protein K5751_12565 [Treponemataceae bacterium]|nr:hypothetical protein [Treponemataceae bacterium]
MAVTLIDGEHHRNPSGCHNKVNWILSVCKWDEQFLCNKKHKTVILENWDFDFCPFCGDAMNL